jgi:hypothetical protein
MVRGYRFRQLATTSARVHHSPRKYRSGLSVLPTTDRRRFRPLNSDYLPSNFTTSPQGVANPLAHPTSCQTTNPKTASETPFQNRPMATRWR